MSDSTPRKLITRGIPTKILTFDGYSFSLQITQGELDAGLAKNMALEKRTKPRHDKFKETQVEKSLKETRLPIAEKRKKHISEASSIKGKEVEASKNSDTLEEKRCEVQHQLFRCFMALQLEGSPDNVFAIHVNGTSLSFSIREFALVIGLKYFGNPADFEFNEKQEDGCSEEVLQDSWDAHRQVWFYECCSNVDPKIALRVDNVVPKILNWRSTENQPNFAYLMNDMFNDKGNMIVYKDIYPTDIELVVIQIPPVGVVVENSPTTRSDKSAEDSDDFTPTPDLQCKKKHAASVDPYSSPPHKKSKEQIIHPSNTENQSMIPPVGVPEIAQNILHHNLPADSKNDEVSSLRKDLNSFKEYVVGEFKSLRSLINDNFKKLSDHLQDNQQKEILHQRKDTIGRRDDSIEIPYVPSCKIYQKNIVVSALFVESRVVGNTRLEVPGNIPHIGQEGVSTDYYVSQFELDDKFLPSQIPETRIVVHNSAKNIESTPLPSHRNRRPSRWYSSPYESNFDSAGTSVKLTPIFEKRHPFEDDSITGPHPTLIIQEYEKWVRDGLLARHEQKSNLEYHYKKNKSTLHIPLDFRVDQVNSKNWFYLLSFVGKLWDDNHINVIFYYLRKKGKYNQTTNFKYTTVDCIFKTRIAEIFDMYADTDSNENVVKEEDVACHDAYVASEIDKLAKLVPLYLSISGFYRDSQGIDWSTYSAYTDKSHTNPFEVVFISNLPQQKAGNMYDCGVHVAAYAEFLSTLGEVPQITFYANLLRQRYGALLWNYDMRNIDIDAISENEAPSKIARQITESDSKLQIVLE
ncbi:uncharacterized protein [Nicotiana sylvestris]|uniref:uncharacterized protein n=1 Tax=Nicotiana sylvestris TaxID=4096 RepID=UPI00388C36FB